MKQYDTEYDTNIANKKTAKSNLLTVKEQPFCFELGLYGIQYTFSRGRVPVDTYRCPLEIQGEKAQMKNNKTCCVKAMLGTVLTKLLSYKYIYTVHTCVYTHKYLHVHRHIQIHICIYTHVYRYCFSCTLNSTVLEAKFVISAALGHHYSIRCM